MEWTEEITLYLIEIYRGKEILWDTKNPWCYSGIKKMIFAQLNLSANFMKF
jgi:hypothetical protein